MAIPCHVCVHVDNYRCAAAPPSLLHRLVLCESSSLSSLSIIGPIYEIFFHNVILLLTRENGKNGSSLELRF